MNTFPVRCDCGRIATTRVILRVHACTVRKMNGAPAAFYWRTPGSRYWQRVDEYETCANCARLFEAIYAGLAGSRLEIEPLTPNGEKEYAA